MPAIAEPHIQRVSHSRLTEPPTKGLTAGMRSPHMDMHDASLGDSQRKTPAVPPKTGRHAEGNRAVLDGCDLPIYCFL